MISKFLIAIFTIVSFSLSGQINLGDTMPYITLKDMKGETVNQSSSNGKFILIDFWASWCAPCRKANQKLVKLHHEYRSKNVEIVGISVDTDRTKWLKAITKDKIEYTQLIDPYGFEAKSAVLYGVESLPATYLFDPSGKLIAINPTEQEIKNHLNQIKK